MSRPRAGRRRRRGANRTPSLPILALVGGCLWLRPERAVDPMVAALQQVDTAWRGRATTGLAPVEALLATALAAEPNDPRVLWRLARTTWLKGYLAADRAEAQTAWETGREYALTCLVTDPEVAASFTQNGWVLAESALARVPPSSRSCLLWGAANGLALVEARGPGGALDAEGACAMVERASALVGPSEPGLLEWEVGTCAWWLAADAEVALASWSRASESGNPLYTLAPLAHLPGTAVTAPAEPEYGLEAAAAAKVRRPSP